MHFAHLSVLEFQVTRKVVIVQRIRMLLMCSCCRHHGIHSQALVSGYPAFFKRDYFTAGFLCPVGSNEPAGEPIATLNNLYDLFEIERHETKVEAGGKVEKDILQDRNS